MPMTPQEQIDCYNGYRKSAQNEAACYDAYRKDSFSDAKHWLDQQMPSIFTTYGVSSYFNPVLSSRLPYITINPDGVLVQSMQVNLGSSHPFIGGVTRSLEQFHYFSNVRPVDTSALSIDVPLLDWHFDAGIFLVNVLTRPDIFDTAWDWSDISRAFAPSHLIEHLPACLAAGLLPEDPKRLYLAICDLLKQERPSAFPLPLDLAPD
jgi:hypothetical protein